MRTRPGPGTVGRRQAVRAVRLTYRPTRKYQFMELNLQRRVAGLKDKMPDIQKTLETVRFLKTRTVRQGCAPTKSAPDGH